MKKKSYLVSYSEGATFKSEKNDCVVRAFCNATGIDYSDAYLDFTLAGREFNKGMLFEHFHPVYKKFLKILCVCGTTNNANYIRRYLKEQKESFADCKGISLERMISLLPKDKIYIVLTIDHALAIVKGKIIDKGTNLGAKSAIACYELK